MTNSNSKWVLGHLVTPYDTTGDYDLLFGESPGNVAGPPPHTHSTYDEVFMVIEGEMEFVVDGKPITVGAGESVDIPTQTVHTFSNKSSQPCKWINIHSPKGFRDFFEEMGVSDQEDQAMEKSVSPELIQKVVQAAEKYDMRIKMEAV